MLKVLMPDLMKVEHNVRVLQEAKSLQTEGYDVLVVGFSNVNKERHLVVDGIKVISFYLDDAREGLGKINRYFTALKMLIGVYRTILTSKAAVYHAHNFHVLPACVFSATLHRGKCVYDTHESWTIHKNKKYHPEHIFAYIVEKLFLRFVDSFVTINEMVASYYWEKYQLNHATLLYNNRSLIPLISGDKIRKELNLSVEKKIAFFVGGFWPSGRGIFELIRSAQYLNEDVAVVFMGFGSQNMLAKMRREIEQVQGEKKVFILPVQPPDKVMEYVMSADIGMNLIKRESRAQDFQSPWKLFEFCMAGLAVVSTDLPFHRKVYEKYPIGVLCDTENSPSSIADSIHKILKEKEQFEQYKKHARMAAEKEYNWQVQEQKLLNMYSDLWD